MGRRAMRNQSEECCVLFLVCSGGSQAMPRNLFSSGCCPLSTPLVSVLKDLYLRSTVCVIIIETLSAGACHTWHQLF